MPKGYYRRVVNGKKEPTYTVDFQYKGRRVAARTEFTSEKDVVKWVREAKARIDQEASQPSTQRPGDLTVHEALEKYWTDRLSLAQSANTSKRYMLLTIAERLGERIKLEELSTADVANYVKRRLEEPKRAGKPGKVTEATVVAELAILKAMHNWAREVWEYPVRAIAWGKVRPTVPHTERPAPTIEHVRALVLAAPTDRLKHVLMFEALTGLRRGEIRRLTWDKIFLEERRMEVLGKGRKTVQVTMSSAVVSLLSSIPRGKSPSVFDMENFRREWDQARREAGLSRFTFHDLRHFFATALGNMGAPTHHIKEALRHSDISTSLIYTQTEQSQLLPYLERLGETLRTSDVSLPLSKTG